MEFQSMNLNIYSNDSNEVWNKMPSIYRKLKGWLGNEMEEESSIPYWFSLNETEKHICASIEPSGLHFEGLMETEEWNEWVKEIKTIATKDLGFKVGEIELGEV